MIYYILLTISILLEVVGVLFLNQSKGFSVFIPTLLAIIFYCSSIAIYISLTANREVGTVNAVFAGLGTVLVTIFGIFFFSESVSMLGIIGIGLIIFGAVSINLKSKTENKIRRVL